MAALQDPSDAGLEALGELVDLERFLSFWATEVAGRAIGTDIPATATTTTSTANPAA